jgi:cytochrome c oxidase assembly protein subunit 15
MSLAEFKGIFWWEYVHRLWGRLIGIVFLVPFLFFWLTGRIPPGMRRRLVFIFLLGGAQGALGWYMVKSGLVDRPDVSQYRLAAHLGLAVAIYGFILWTAWGLRETRGRAGPAGPIGAVTAGLLFITILAGAFVAGIDAGRDYNTWPLMDGHFVPAGYGGLDPWWRNLFENIPSVQFNHRWLAALVALHVLLLWRRTEKAGGKTQIAGRLALAAVGVQFTLGIATLITAVPVSLGALHQTGAMVLFTAVLWANHRVRVTN